VSSVGTEHDALPDRKAKRESFQRKAAKGPTGGYHERMTWNVLIALAACLTVSACGSARCEWPHEEDAALDLTNAIQERHLRDDAHGARTFAVRYGDASVILPTGPEAGGWNERMAVHRDAVRRCEASLTAAIAAIHHLAPAQIRALSGSER
jgi:hypothetical protein